jgi:hypothetical protein
VDIFEPHSVAAYNLKMVRTTLIAPALLLVLACVQAGKLVQYNFYENAGEIAFDVASKKFHAVAGRTAFPSDNNQAIQTGYSGWYFNGSSSNVYGPPNSVFPPGILLPQTFTIDMWWYP